MNTRNKTNFTTKLGSVREEVVLCATPQSRIASILFHGTVFPSFFDGPLGTNKASGQIMPAVFEKNQ